ncbi:MAG: MBL fold metallo-hydrolase, partial [Chloroflexota bacterium]
MEHRLRVGGVEIHLISDGFARVDGGGMFGLVPRLMWQKKHPADEFNRIGMGVNSLLIRDGEHQIVVDTGFGGKMGQRTLNLMGIERTGQLPQRLQDLGVAPDRVALVINTHLHSDHSGGNTTQEGKQLSLAFPNATYIVQRGEWEDANHPNERTRATYLPENLLPLWETRHLELIEGDTQITPHVRCMLTPGHTPHHQSVLIESEGQKALYTADLSPFVVHMERLAWIAAYDLEPMRSIETRRWAQRWAVDERVLLIFPHDPEIGMGYLHYDSGRFWLDPVELAAMGVP